MKWPARLFFAAACACGHAASESELSSGTSETTLTESQCSETVKKVQASGKYTEDAILPICSSEVKSSKCDFFAEALSLASTHADFAAKVFCKDIAEAHQCSQMMDSLYESVTTRDLLFGECMRSQEGKSEQYCMKFKSLLGRAVHESDLDTMRACYMMQAYDEKEGPIEPKQSPAKKESKDEKAPPKPKVNEASAKANHAQPANASVKVLSQKTAKVAEKVATQPVKASDHQKPVVKGHHQEVNASRAKHAMKNVTKPAGNVKPAAAKTIGKHEDKPSNPKKSATKPDAIKPPAVAQIAHKETLHAKASPPKEVKTSQHKTNSSGIANKTSQIKKNTTAPKGKVALAKTNASAARAGSKNNATAAEKAADEKKYGGFLSGFVF